MASGVLSNSRHGSLSQVIEEIELGIAMASKDAQAEPPVPQSLATSVEAMLHKAPGIDTKQSALLRSYTSFRYGVE